MDLPIFTKTYEYQDQRVDVFRMTTSTDLVREAHEKNRGNELLAVGSEKLQCGPDGVGGGMGGTRHHAVRVATHNRGSGKVVDV